MEDALGALEEYIDTFDNPYWSDAAMKEWLDSYWIPHVRAILDSEGR